MVRKMVVISLTVALFGAGSPVTESASPTAGHVRIKDVTRVDGQMTHRLMGVGLVTGLNGTGGRGPKTREFVANMLQRYGNRLSPEIRAGLRNDTKFTTNNVSAVMVIAEIPEYYRPGMKFDVTVSSIDDAKSLNGGILLISTLSGIDGIDYAEAWGPVSTGGFDVSGNAGSAQKNHPTSGIVPRGGQLVAPLIETDARPIHSFSLALDHPDIETAKRIANAVNTFARDSARVESPAAVVVNVPVDYLDNVAGFMAEVQALRVQPDLEARVVINERTGTVIVNGHVRLSQVAITHGNLSIAVSENPQVVQPEPLAQGETAVVPRTSIEVAEEERTMQVVPETANVQDLANALNALGVTPRDLSSIFQQLNNNGALQGKLIIK